MTFFDVLPGTLTSVTVGTGAPTSDEGVIVNFKSLLSLLVNVTSTSSRLEHISSLLIFMSGNVLISTTDSATVKTPLVVDIGVPSAFKSYPHSFPSVAQTLTFALPAKADIHASINSSPAPSLKILSSTVVAVLLFVPLASSQDQWNVTCGAVFPIAAQSNEVYSLERVAVNCNVLIVWSSLQYAVTLGSIFVTCGNGKTYTTISTGAETQF